MPSLSDNIKQKAIEIGFHKVGIVGADALSEERSHLEQWLARGYQGEMKWMQREPEKRSDPRILFPPAKSVIVVGLNYYTPHKHEIDQNSGKISRYAWGDDYHDVLNEKLRILLEWIKTQGRRSRRQGLCRYRPDHGQSLGRPGRDWLAR